ncbi:MAG: hypothetical protein [Bacteriophage sp.]|nr:MAG: hypothetical protein [Bacteriophage sp.]
MGNPDPNSKQQPNQSQQPNNDSVDIEGIKKSASQEALTQLFKKLGVDSADDLQKIIQAKQEADKANNTELENAQAELKKVNGSLDEKEKKINDLQAQNAVLKAGVSKDHIEDVTILAQAQVANGSVADFKTAVDDVLKRNPQFKNATQTGPDGTAIVSNNVGGTKTSKITADMSLDELTKAAQKDPNVLNEYMKTQGGK